MIYIFKRVKPLIILVFILFICTNNKIYANTEFTFKKNPLAVTDYNIRVGMAKSASYNITVDNSYVILADNLLLESQPITITTYSLDIVNNKLRLRKGSEIVTIANKINFVLLDNNEYNYKYLTVTYGNTTKRLPDNVSFHIYNSTIVCVNNVNIEKYLLGVLPFEMSASYPIEALKAQAVAARSYAIANKNKHDKEGYDICNTTCCQVYDGYNTSYFNPNSRVWLAVYSTYGQVLAYNNKIISAFFTASNGGYTANIEDVWSSSHPVFVSKRDTFDNYPWKITYTPTEIVNILKNRGVNITSLEDIEIKEKKPNGYVTWLQINKSINYYKDATRYALKLKSMIYDIIKNYEIKLKGITGNITTLSKSNDFIYVRGTDNKLHKVDIKNVKLKGSDNKIYNTLKNVEFNGNGFGHGVGLSQIGARNRANAGQNYLEILNFYYNNTQIVENYNIPVVEQ